MAYKEWEYKVGSLSGDQNLEDSLNLWGRYGWELVSVYMGKIFSTFVMKRPLVAKTN